MKTSFPARFVTIFGTILCARQRTGAEASAAPKLVDEGHLLRLWRWTAVTDDMSAIGLCAAEAQFDGRLRALPLADWMQVTLIPLAPHPNDPALVAR
jgi:muconolactone D-isomerase